MSTVKEKKRLKKENFENQGKELDITEIQNRVNYKPTFI